MYLKNIEVQGFKSFAHKIVFEFHNGITGIVGPNGSGKSNVADAVRWVLGEQKVKQLRSSSMQDVIFAGTEARKPQGFAFVAITLDNADHALAIDFDEVTVSRRLYRSGESEYLLNGSPCRLKDINELFYDTGIGKEGYSIIGQGQIDKILSGRPEERRELFDEAAGIVKFKRRKAIAQKKLEDEKQNLVRVSDILNELEKQVGPLARQAETAREYLRLREELKSFDVNLFLAETDSIGKDLAENEERSAAVSGDMEEARAKSETLRAEFEKLSGRIRDLDEEITESQNAKNGARIRIGEYEGRINVLREQIKTEETNAENIKSRLEAIDGELAQKADSGAAAAKKQTELLEEAESMKEKLTEAEEKNSAAAEEIARLEQAVESGKAAQLAAVTGKSDLAVERKGLDTLLEQTQVRRSEIAQKLLKVRSDEETWQEKINAGEETLGEIDGQVAELLEEADRLEEETKAVSAEIAGLNRDLGNTQQEYHKQHSRLDSLKNLAERYEGYGNSIRRVMEMRESVSGIHGVVADLIEVPKEYEVAIETALGGSIQNVVTDTEETAKILIEHLKRNKYGRATFLPLTGITARGGMPSEDVLIERGVIGIAGTLVKSKPEYRGLVNYLLGKVLVVDHIDHAIAIARKYRHSLRIVTPDGELLNPGGSLSGGAFKNAGNLLGRRRELEELEENCKNALRRVDELQKELVGRERILEEKKEALKAVNHDLQQKYIEENTAKLNLKQLIARRDEVIGSTADLDSDNRRIEQEMRDLKEKIGSLEDKLTGWEEAAAKREETLAADSQALEEAKSRKEEAAAALTGLQLLVSQKEQQYGFLKQEIDRLSEESGRLREEREALEGGTEVSADAVKAREDEIRTLGIRIEEEKENEAANDRRAAAAKAAREEAQNRQNGFISERDELSDRISRLDKDLFRLQNQREKLEERRDSSVEYMWSEYQLTYSTAGELRDENAPAMPELKREIADRKNRIRALGSVNVNAIEDYREISGRYEFMKAQHGDLVTAQEALLQVIDELDRGMREQFTEKFAEIREEFDRVFRELFGGGHGRLELVEDEDILEAGISIISQPPGKKLQNMMQMSGGEKSLTAIALLFAIQNLKPSPFCLLDEIEAALDDSNVDRFAGYLHKLTRHTQFIVITHRRGTMVAADRLYGITMQEKGVSTLVSVNLVENDLK